MDDNLINELIKTIKKQAALREAEEKYDFIIVENLKEEGLGASVMNRVNKASSNNKV